MKLENGSQPKSGLVDEIVHISFVPAVIVAAKEPAAARIEKDPVGGMDGGDAAQRAAGGDMARRPVYAVEDDQLDPEPKPAGLDRSHGRILIGDVVILAQAQLGNPRRVISVDDDRIALLAPAQLEQEEREADHEQ